MSDVANAQAPAALPGRRRRCLWPTMVMAFLLVSVLLVDHAAARKAARRRPPELHEVPVEYRNLVQWLTANEVDFSRLAVQETPEHGIGVVAVRRITPGERFLAVPGQLLMTQEDVRQLRVWPAAQAAGMDASTEGLAFLLLCERSLGRASKWYPHIAILPESVPLPFLLPDAEQRILSETNMAPVLSGIVQYLKWAWNHHWLPVLRQHPAELPRAAFTYARYLWASSILLSRSFDFDTPDGASERVMAPGMDLLNHDASVASQILYKKPRDGPSELAFMRTDRDILPGEQVMISYGEKSNRELWAEYGFTLHDNPHDTYLLRLTFPPALDQASQATRSEIFSTRFGLRHGATFVDVELYANTHRSARQLWATARALVLRQTDVQDVASVSLDTVLSDANEQAACQYLHATLTHLMAQSHRVASEAPSLSSDQRFLANLVNLLAGEQVVLASTLAEVNEHCVDVANVGHS